MKKQSLVIAQRKNKNYWIVLEQLIPFEKAEHPEAAIYEDFDKFDRDTEIMRSFHEANPTKIELVNCFSDARLEHLLEE